MLSKSSVELVFLIKYFFKKAWIWSLKKKKELLCIVNNIFSREHILYFACWTNRGIFIFQHTLDQNSYF